MKTMLTIAATLAFAYLLLRSDRTPWQIVSKAELDQTRREAAAHSEHVVPAPTPDHSGAWMWDPSYRTALEKTTVVGVPEAAKSREHNRGTVAPTPPQ